MNAAESSMYEASFRARTRVRLVKSSHSLNGQTAVVIRALPNPSGNPGHQWYDVRFDNGVLGRFLERYLLPVSDIGDKETPSTDEARIA